MSCILTVLVMLIRQVIDMIEDPLLDIVFILARIGSLGVQKNKQWFQGQVLNHNIGHWHQ